MDFLDDRMNLPIQGGGLYLLDEPEVALSPQRQLTLLLEIVNCAKEDTDSYQITKMFIESKEQLLKRLLSDDGVDS